MRLAFAAFTLILSGGAVAVVACSSDATPASPGSSTSSGNIGSSNGSSGNQQTDGGSGVDAGGFWYSPTGCIIHCTEHKQAGRIQNVSRSDKPSAIAWDNPNGGLKEDSDLASVTLQENDETQYLQVDQFDFSEVTDDKSTWGISVELVRHSTDGGVEDAIINVSLPGKTTKGKVLDGDWPRVIVGTHHYGQAIDTWDADLNPSDVRPAAFGAYIAAKHKAGVSGPVYAQVDSLKVAVCYCNADGK